jgi:NADPH-dependent curcumin reductase CurA
VRIYLSGASIPFVGLTAYNAILEFGKVKPQQHVLLIGAGGGVGKCQHTHSSLSFQLHFQTRSAT